MTTTTKRDWIPALRDLAQRNYSKGYGWQMLVECWGESEWLDLVGRCETWADALALTNRVADLQTDRYNDANGEIL
jgi:hypothetical protein